MRAFFVDDETGRAGTGGAVDLEGNIGERAEAYALISLKKKKRQQQQNKLFY